MKAYGSIAMSKQYAVGSMQKRIAVHCYCLLLTAYSIL
jgi:hypothetical protein